MIRLISGSIAAWLIASLHAADNPPPVAIRDLGKDVVLSNGTMEATISKSNSTITSMKFGSHEMVGSRRPVYYSMGGGKSYRQPAGAEFSIIRQSPDIAEIAFLQKWKPGNNQAVDIEVRYALKRGEAGIHTYGVLSHPADYPETAVGEWRMVWGMPQKNDGEWLMEKIRVDRQRDWEMPSPADLAKAKPTEISEIVEITSGHRAGRFDCKYDFNLEYHTTGCWGHASDRNQLGAWVVLGSHEFFNDGPMKQDLSSASGIIHIHFGMNHFGGSAARIAAGREWSKMYGPFLLYCNRGGNADALWADARAKAASERKLWPHDWVNRPSLYPPHSGRGTVRGRLSIKDPLKPDLPVAGAWVGLSQPAPGGNFQNESNYYQYWSKADAAGDFEIPHVRPGSYALSAVATGVVGEFEMPGALVKPGVNQAGDLVWEVPRLGKSIAWEIGVPDRRADEFRHGDDYFRGYVWKNFSKEFRNPLVFTIGKSDPAKDWNFAQGSYLKNGKCVVWPWEIHFRLADVPREGMARLTIALAGAERARLNVAVNGKNIQMYLPSISGGNALLREGIHSTYSFNHVDFPVSGLKSGNNTLTLTQTRNEGPQVHVMYDSITLEMP